MSRRSRRLNKSSDEREPVPQWFFAAFTGDRSGSMTSMDGASATGLYEWIQTMKQSAIDNNQTGFISVTTFDNIKNKLFDNIDSKSLKFTINDAEREMSPRGTTRLYDTAIEDIDDLLDNVETFKKTLPKNIRKLNPNISITWVCCTDGMDNNSINTSEDLRERVIDARKKGVKCFFIAANQDAIMAGNNYGFTRDSSLTFSANRVNASMAFRSVSENMKQHLWVRKIHHLHKI